MIIVLDANIVFMALMGSRATLTIITSQNHSLYVPAKFISEIRKYSHQICARKNISIEEFEINLDALLNFIRVIDFMEYEPYFSVAERSISTRDVNDADYIACALAVRADFIWSNDKDFTEQKLITVKTTEQFINESR